MPGLSSKNLRKLFLEELNETEVERLGFDWPVWARLKQRPPSDGWRTWLVLGGRGAGKTRTGAEWLKGVALADPHFAGDAAGRIALVGESYDDIRDVMIEGESGILAIHSKADRPDWFSSRRELVWKNGTIAKLFSSADPEGLRGNQFGAAWGDVFFDPKSSQSALPYFSAGSRDDLAQRRFLEAHLDYWDDPQNNPMSPNYQGRMVATNRLAIWAWDARPFPWFPKDLNAWSDGENWMRGHWLNGRLGACPLEDLVRAMLADHDFLDADIRLDGVVDGYVIPSQSSARRALEPLMALFDVQVDDVSGKLRFLQLPYADRTVLRQNELVQEECEPLKIERRNAELELPSEVLLSHASVFSDYEETSAKSRRLNGESERQISLRLPVVIPDAMASSLADKKLRSEWHERQSRAVTLSTGRLEISPGDIVQFEDEGSDTHWRVESVDVGAAQSLRLQSVLQETLQPGYSEPITPLLDNTASFGKPLAVVMDLPSLRDADREKSLAYVAATARPWAGRYDVYSSATNYNYQLRSTIDAVATFGRLTAPLLPGPFSRLDLGNSVSIAPISGGYSGQQMGDILNGGNALAVENRAGNYEVLQFVDAELQQDGSWLLSKLLRGQRGTVADMQVGSEAGAYVILLNTAVLPVEMHDSDVGRTNNWRVGPSRDLINASSYTQLSFNYVGRSRNLLAPVHLRRQKQTIPSGLRISWIRSSRFHADNWENAEVPLDARFERYLIRILNASGKVVRETEVFEPQFSYSDEMQQADMGGTHFPYSVEVAQIGDTGLPGAFSKLDINS